MYGVIKVTDKGLLKFSRAHVRLIELLARDATSQKAQAALLHLSFSTVSIMRSKLYKTLDTYDLAGFIIAGVEDGYLEITKSPVI